MPEPLTARRGLHTGSLQQATRCLRWCHRDSGLKGSKEGGSWNSDESEILSRLQRKWATGGYGSPLRPRYRTEPPVPYSWEPKPTDGSTDPQPLFPFLHTPAEVTRLSSQFCVRMDTCCRSPKLALFSYSPFSQKVCRQFSQNSFGSISPRTSSDNPTRIIRMETS